MKNILKVSILVVYGISSLCLWLWVSADSWLILTGTSTTWMIVPTAVITMDSPLISTKPIGKKKYVAKPRPITLGKFFVDVCGRLGQWMPNVYQDITISWPNLQKDSPIYVALQKCAYMGIVETKGKVTNFQVPVKGNFVYDFLWQKLNMDISAQLQPDEAVLSDVWEQEIRYRIPTYYGIQRLLKISGFGSNWAYESDVINSTHFTTFANVFSQIQQNYHYLSGDTSDSNLLYGAIKWMVDALQNQYSVYFPPEQAADFYNSIQGEYYGIWMYVDVRNNKFVVWSTIPGEPAHVAWLQPWDIVLSVNDRDVPEVFSLNDVVSRIKWPADTMVTLKIQRGISIFNVNVKRKKIIIPLMKTEKKWKSMVFTLNSFGQGMTYLFGSWVDTYKNDIKAADKIIIDVRNNPGWYVEEAAWILSYFVPKDEPLINMEEKNHMQTLFSLGTSNIFSGKQLYILINGWSASASEIVAGTLKDYYPSAKIVWEKSYGKWSAQTVMWLPNGWSVKYTIALWYTGKLNRSIEKVGITPDIELKDDSNTIEDEVLDKILGW